MNVINSAGAAATQTVFHTHVHLVPRRGRRRRRPALHEKRVGAEPRDRRLDELQLLDPVRVQRRPAAGSRVRPLAQRRH
ncbi:HIT domain-containing protein [Streptomyces sp. CA-251387]|uniref:HIT domain-containing protein n=1 Tax=Streptomyces sp. CA-251387 TaxID=3240064 RepID=UPI003D8FC097